MTDIHTVAPGNEARGSSKDSVILYLCQSEAALHNCFTKNQKLISRVCSPVLQTLQKQQQSFFLMLCSAFYTFGGGQKQVSRRAEQTPGWNCCHKTLRRRHPV